MGLAIAGMVFLGAAAIIAVGCIVLAKYGKSLVSSQTAGTALVQSVLWSLLFTVGVALSSTAWMVTVYASNYGLGGGFHRGEPSLVAAMLEPAITFFVDVATSLFVSNRIKVLVGDRKWIGTALTAAAMFLIFGVSTVVSFILSGFPLADFAEIPGIVISYLMNSVGELFAMVFALATDFSTGWPWLLQKVDVRGNFFLLTDVMSKSFFVIALLTGIGFIGHALARPDASDAH